MKITYLIDSLSAGGKERQLLYLLKELSKTDDIQLIILNEDIFYNDVLELPIKIQIISKQNRYKIKTLFRIYKLVKSHNPVLIHSWSNAITLTTLPYLILHQKVKLISSIRNAFKIKKNIKGIILKRIAKVCSAAIVSNSKKGLIVNNLVNNKKGIVIHNGIDINYFDLQANEQYSKLNLINEFKCKIVMVGRFYKAKDYQTFIKAAKIVYKKTNDTAIVCIGSGPGKEHAEKQANDLLNKNIFFLGNRKDIPALLKIMDIGVLLNNTNVAAEGISNSIMEYMAAGLPVIATNAGGTPELVQDGLSGFLVPAFDENIVAEKIVYLINNPDKARGMGKRGREIIKNEFSITSFTSKYLILYKNIACGK